MTWVSGICLIGVFLLSPYVFVSGALDSLNVILPPGGRECFYDDIPADAAVRKIEVFVPSGASVDVLLEVMGPLSMAQIRSGELPKPFVTESVSARKQEHSESQSFTQDFEPDAPGVYAYCVDNRNSRFVPRKVQLMVRTIEDDDDKDDEKALAKHAPPVYHEDKEVNERLGQYLQKMRDGLAQVQQQQHIDRNRLSLNSETNRASHNDMVMGSIFETLAYIVASLFQIFFVRRWFLARPSAGNKRKNKADLKEWA